MEAISLPIRPYSSVENFSSSLDRKTTVEHIPKVAMSIIAKRIHEGINRNPLSAVGNKSRENSRAESAVSLWAALPWFVCLLLSQ